MKSFGQVVRLIKIPVSRSSVFSQVIFFLLLASPVQGAMCDISWIGRIPGKSPAPATESELAAMAIREGTTLFPLDGTHIRPGVRASRVRYRLGQERTLKRFLENTTVESVENNRITVVSGFGEGLTRGHLTVGDIYQPIVPGKHVYFQGEEGMPFWAKIIEVDDRGGRVVLERFNGDGTVRIPFEDLRLTPRGWTRGSLGDDQTIPASTERLKELLDEFNDLHMLYEEHRSSESFVRKNNKFMRKIQKLMHGQGISTRLVESHHNSSILYLVIHGVYPNGNKVARDYIRMLEKRFYTTLQFSPVDFFTDKSKMAALFDSGEGILDVGVETLLYLLRKQAHPYFFHEANYAMVEAKRRSGIMSIFDYNAEVKSDGRGKDVRNLYGDPLKSRSSQISYSQYISFEEVYAYGMNLTHEIPFFKLVLGDTKTKDSVLMNLNSLLRLSNNIHALVTDAIKKRKIDFLIDPDNKKITRVDIDFSYSRQITLERNFNIVDSPENRIQLERQVFGELEYARNFFESFAGEVTTAMKTIEGIPLPSEEQLLNAVSSIAPMLEREFSRQE